MLFILGGKSHSHMQVFYVHVALQNPSVLEFIVAL